VTTTSSKQKQQQQQQEEDISHFLALSVFMGARICMLSG
jgi:hypothetical protein